MENSIYEAEKLKEEGNTFLWKNQFDRALEKYQQAIDKNPK